MYLTIHNKIQFMIWKLGLGIHDINLGMITMLGITPKF